MRMPRSARSAASARSERVSSSHPSAAPVTDARSAVSIPCPRNAGDSPWRMSTSAIGANHAAVVTATSTARAAACPCASSTARRAGGRVRRLARITAWRSVARAWVAGEVTASERSAVPERISISVTPPPARSLI